MKEIKYPSEKTYYICYTDSRLCNWGSIGSEQTLSTGHDNLFQTANYDEWINELTQNFHVVTGYQFDEEATGTELVEKINHQLGEGTVSLLHAQFNTPQFWYVAGNFEVAGEPTLFQVFPD